MIKCEWCGKYHTNGIYAYLRGESTFRKYDFCSNKCCSEFETEYNLIRVNSYGYTQEEERELSMNIDNSEVNAKVKDLFKNKDIKSKEKTKFVNTILFSRILQICSMLLIVALIAYFLSGFFEFLFITIFYFLWFGKIRDLIWSHKSNYFNYEKHFNFQMTLSAIISIFLMYFL